MAIDVYHGTYITAEDAKDYIDKDTIMKGCSMMTEAAEKIDVITQKICELRDLCTGDVLTVNGETMENNIEEYETDTRDFSLYIKDLSETITTATQKEFNKKQTILNEEAKRKEKQLMQGTENN